jgi:ADP-heptose:LPS heptosyltransferase
MHPQAIRFIDRWLGVPLCALLTLVRLVLPARRQPPRKVLFLKFIEQGATVLAQDAIARATALVGRDNVYFCVFEGNRAILDVLDTIPSANIIAIRDRSLLTCLVDFVKALRTVRAAGIDTTIDMEFFSRASAIFAFLTGAATRVGLHRFTSEYPYRGDLLTHRVQYNPYIHVSTQYALLVEAARHEPSEVPLLKVPLPLVPLVPRGTTPAAAPVFTPTPDETERVSARVAQLAGGAAGVGRPLVLLNPNASDMLPLRRWAGDRFVELGQRILAQHPTALIVVTGAPGERAGADAVCTQIGSSRAVSLAGQTTLRELLTLYTLADVLVTNDSGPAHFASLTPVSTVVLFGPETPRLFGALSPATVVIWKELACSPCVNVFNHRFSPCTNNVCMQAITVDEVNAAVTSCLSAARAS